MLRRQRIIQMQHLHLRARRHLGQERAVGIHGAQEKSAAVNMENQLGGFILRFEFFGAEACQAQRADADIRILRNDPAKLLQRKTHCAGR